MSNGNHASAFIEANNTNLFQASFTVPLKNSNLQPGI